MLHPPSVCWARTWRTFLSLFMDEDICRTTSASRVRGSSTGRNSYCTPLCAGAISTYTSYAMHNQLFRVVTGLRNNKGGAHKYAKHRYKATCSLRSRSSLFFCFFCCQIWQITCMKRIWTLTVNRLTRVVMTTATFLKRQRPPKRQAVFNKIHTSCSTFILLRL